MFHAKFAAGGIGRVLKRVCGMVEVEEELLLEEELVLGLLSGTAVVFMLQRKKVGKN